MAIGWREVGVGSSAPVDECWRVGVLFSQTGNTAVIEETQLCGTVLAIKEINAAGGVHAGLGAFKEIGPISLTELSTLEKRRI